MQRVLIGSLFLAALFGVPGPSWGSVVNGGFEDDGGSLSAWTTFNNSIPNVTVSSQTPRTGSYSAKVFGGFNGDPNAAGLFQGLAVVAGEVWEASAYARYNSSDPLSGTSTRVMLKIEFYRVFGGSYGTSDMISEHELVLLDGTVDADVWHTRSLEVVAPAEAVEARLAFVFLQFGNATGAALIDDVTFQAVSTPEAIDWELLWADEFDAPEVDTSKWRVEDVHLIKNNEQQYYTPQDVYIQDGALVLRSQERSYWGFDENGAWRNFDYTSGLVESLEHFATAYGRIEIRGQLPFTQGIWPAYWMLPTSGGWPPEIDIMELLGHDPTRVYMTHHWGSWPNVISAGGDFVGPDFSADWHTYAVEWMPGRLDWYVDGVRRFVSTTNVPEEPFYVILNTAVGGNWPGYPDGTTVFPQHNLIDYVRVFTPIEIGTPMAQIVDDTELGGNADGRIDPGEYVATVAGINDGFGDLIGAGSLLHLDSSGGGRYSFAIESAAPWPTTWSGGAVIYIDSRAGGLASTYGLTDVGDVAQRMVSGMSSTGARGDLFFALGFRADFAICLTPDLVTVYELQESSLSVVNSAALGAAVDMGGGSDLVYRLDDGASGFRLREIEGALSGIGLTPGDSFDFVVTLINGDTAFRSSEFVGVTSGNVWDGDNVGVTPAILKIGDYVRVTTAPATVAPIPSVSAWGLVIMALLLLCVGTHALRGTQDAVGDAYLVTVSEVSKEMRI